MPTLHDLWPRPFVHIIRATGTSALAQELEQNGQRRGPLLYLDGGPGDDDGSLVEVERAPGTGRRQPLGPDFYHEVRYEELVSEPEQRARRSAPSSASYDDAMLRFHEGREKADPDLDAKKAWRPVTAGLRVWESEMSAEEVERFEAAGGDLLDELGYPRTILHLRHYGCSRRLRGFTARSPRISALNATGFRSDGEPVRLHRRRDAVGDDAVAANGRCAPRPRRHPRDALDPALLRRADRPHARRHGHNRASREAARRSQVRQAGHRAGGPGGPDPPDGPISYADYVTRIFDLYGEARGKRSVGRKPRAT